MKDKKSIPSSRYGFAWWVKNLLLAAALYMICPRVAVGNEGYAWLIAGYARSNREAVAQMRGMSYDQRLEAKLGYDYAFVEMIRRATPDSAVVYYPSREDFTAGGAGVEFTGALCDKLSAVRFLYPRRVVIGPEMGKTSWSSRLTHVAVVNGRGLELLPYKVAGGAAITVLPVDSAAAARQMSQRE